MYKLAGNRIYAYFVYLLLREFIKWFLSQPSANGTAKVNLAQTYLEYFTRFMVIELSIKDYIYQLHLSKGTG